MEFSQYLADVPKLHSWDGGKTWSTGGFQAQHLEPLHDIITKNFTSPKIIETGAGNSTVTFLFCNPHKVTSICPNPDLFQRIRDYCDKVGLDHASLDVVVDISQNALPEVRKHGTVYDFLLIDGAHGWPHVMVDFCYMNACAGEGSLIMIDDVELHSIGELMRLLDEQPGFERVADLGKSVIYRKLTNARWLPEWNEQPYIKRMSETG